MSFDKLHAGIHPRHEGCRLDNFVATSKAQTHALANCEAFVEEAKNLPTCHNLILIGQPGTGKTHLACGIVNELFDGKGSVMIREASRMINRVKACWSRDSESDSQEIIDAYADLDVLIIDEVGAGLGTPSERAILFDVINGRYLNKLPTILISNLTIDQLKVEIGERAIDRLREPLGIVCVLDGKSHRGAVNGKH